MQDQDKSKQELIEELAEMRRRVASLETALQENQSAAALLHVAPLGIYELDTTGRITFANPSQEAIAGYTADELVGTYVRDRIQPGPEREALHACLEHLVSEQPAPTPYFAKNFRKNGEVFDVRVDWNYKRNPQGQVTGFVCILCDITEKNRAEAALRESESRYRALAESTRDIIFILDRQGTLLYANQAASQCIGIPAGDIVGKRQVDLFPPEMARFQIEKTGRVLTSGEVIEYDDCFHFGPAEVWLRIHLIPIRDEAGQITSVMGVCHNITERKQTELALIEREAQLLEAQEVANLGFCVVDLTTGQITTSPVIDRIFGLPADYEKTIDEWAAFVHSDEHQEMLDYLKQVVAEKKPFDREYRIVRYGDKQVRWVHGRGRLQFNEAGQPISILGTVQDITERKQAEDALQKAHDELEQRVKERTAELARANENLDIFRKFAEASREGFGMSTLDGNTVYINPALCRMLGEERPEDVIGKHVSAYYPADYMKRRKEELLPTLLREGHWHIEQTVLPRHGQPIHTFQSTFLIRDENGKPFRVAVVISDVTDRKRVEEALQRSEERYRTLMDNIHSGITVMDSNLNIVMLNKASAALIGRPTRKCIGEKCFRVFRKQDAVCPDCPGVRAMNTGQAAEVENIGARDDGSVYVARVRAYPIFAADGHVEGFVELVEDITDRKRAEEALAKEHRNLRHMLRSSDNERQLIAYEIHDGLAQQLAAAIMQFDAFDHLKTTKPKQAADAYNAGITMLRQGHFETRRLIAGVRPPILDEEGIVEAVAHLVHELGRDKGPKIENHSRVDFDRLDPTLENAIYRIAQEALTNACKHGKSDRISVSLLQREDLLRIEIRDWGVGFDPKTVPKSHFGLEGIRQRARLLGGKCNIRSTAGRGTRIMVELPVIPRDEEG